MPDFPPEVITLATEAVARELRKAFGQHDPSSQVAENMRRLGFDLATAALDAAAPALGDACAKAILRHSDEHEPSPGSRLYLTWHRHFGIAARIAGRAFLTDEDLKRAAAEALARGDFTACSAPEVPSE